MFFGGSICMYSASIKTGCAVKQRIDNIRLCMVIAQPEVAASTRGF